MSTDAKQERSIKTSGTIFDIIEFIKESGPVTGSEVAEHVDLATSTAYDHLSTLERIGYLVCDDKRYKLSLKFLNLGMTVLEDIPLVQVSDDVVERLARETKELAWLVVEENGWVVYVGMAEGENAVTTRAQLGARAHLHYPAAGKAILAHLSRERVEAIIDQHGLPKQTKYTITEPNTLFNKLEEIRERGYAFNESEEVRGVTAIGAPIIREGKVIGSISVSGPANRLKKPAEREQIIEKVLSATNEIELKMDYH